MTNENPAERISSADRFDTDRRPVPSEWQFSLRGLLIATTVVSVCLALGTYFAGAAFVAFVLVLMQAATLLFADWLIRPANRRILAFVTAGSWMIAGSGLLIIGANVGYGVMSESESAEMWAAIVFLVLLAAFCYGFGWQRWRQLIAHRRENL